ncbi:MAG: SdpI family protein, partial [Anaerovoracaceae bacterium]
IIFHKSPINRIIGFYTKLSIKNKSTWQYGNLLTGKLCLFVGVSSFLFSLLFSLFSPLSFKKLLLYIFLFNILSWIIIWVVVNDKLHENFDDFGNKKR